MINQPPNNEGGANKPKDYDEIIQKEDLIDIQQLHQAELIEDLQTLLFEITQDKLETSLHKILTSIFISEGKYIAQLSRNIFFAARFRPMKIELLSDFVTVIISHTSPDNFIGDLKISLLQLFFDKAFHDEHSYKETWRYFFLYQLLKRNVFTDIEIIDQIRQFHSKYIIEKKEIGLFKIMNAWFAPEIEKNAPDLFSLFFPPAVTKPEDNSCLDIDQTESNELPFIFQGNDEDETRVFDILRNQGYTREILQNNDWELYRQCREWGYTVSPLILSLLSDNDDQLQKLSSDPDFDVDLMIDPSLFSRATILQDSTSPICFAAAVGAVKCFRFLLISNANLDYETWNEYSTTIASFAVAGGNYEIVRLLDQKKKSFNEALFVAVQYHQTSIFKWLFQNLNPDIEVRSPRYGTLLHRAAKSNNIELSLFCMEHKCDVNRPVPNHFIFFFLFN